MAIRILADQVVNQIAAGEVVERPASVVKELLENALDAGARVLELTLKDGGIALVRLTDDGHGMDRADAMMCVERHATSKIREVADLDRIASLGFRGEALPSIASVSRFRLRTRPSASEVGTELRIEGGRLVHVGPVACAAGTEIDVASLFTNVPARRKFLRAPSTELAHCVEEVSRQALAHPEVDVTVRHQGREVLRAPRAPDLATRARDVLGPVAADLVPVEVDTDRFALRGLASRVGVDRSTAVGAVYLFVNGRYVRDAVFRRAVYEAYRELVPHGRYPVVVLDLRLDPAQVDVNVHPTKIEVRFREPREVGRGIAASLRPVVELTRSAVRSLDRFQPHRDDPASPRLPFSPPPDPTPSLPAHPDDDPRAPPRPEEEVGPLLVAEDSGPPDPPTDRPEPGGAPDGPRFRDLRVIGHLASTFLLCEDDGDLVVIDRVAAEERVTASRLQRRGEAALGPTQRLLTPALLELPEAVVDLLAARPEVIGALHLDLEPFGATQLAARAVPTLLHGVDLAGLLCDLAEELRRGDDELPRRVRELVASHHAARPHPPLTYYELRSLLAALDEAGARPDGEGRGLAARVAAADLERLFRRPG